MRLWQELRQLPWAIRLLVAVAALFVFLSLDWRPARVSEAPRLLAELHASGELQAGAARVSLDPPFPTPVGGLGVRDNEMSTGILNPLGARALVVQVGGRRVGLVSAELVVAPDSLRRKVQAATADLRLDELLVGATHTHTGPGGYWRNRFAQWLGLGAYDPRIEEFLAAQLSTALRIAAQSLGPARFAVGRIQASNFAYNRNETNGPADNTLTAAKVTGLDGRRIANLIIFAAHPTIIPGEETRLSGDWPGALMASFEAESGPPTLFFQGAMGDLTWGKRQGDMTLQQRAVRFGQAVANDARGALVAGGDGESSLTLDAARVRVGLPRCDVSGAVSRLFEPIASNLFCFVGWPGAAEVSSLRLGGLELASVPGEVVSALGQSWRGQLAGATVLSLMDGYVGYVETPAAMEGKVGEARHAYFGPSLAPVLFEGLRIAHEAAGGPRAVSRSSP